MTEQMPLPMRVAGAITLASAACCACAAAAFALGGAPTAHVVRFAHEGLTLGDPVLWLGVGLVLSPSVYQRLKRRSPADDPSYAGYAYVECPVCQHVVPLSYDRCPLCGAELLAPWVSASREA